jgi:hypothetical protein
LIHWNQLTAPITLFAVIHRSEPHLQGSLNSARLRGTLELDIACLSSTCIRHLALNHLADEPANAYLDSTAAQLHPKMTIRAKKFTPEVLLSAPRRSSAIPNADGTLALFTVSTYSFHTHSRSSEIRVLHIKTGRSKLLSDDVTASEPVWLGEKNLVLWLKGGEKGTTSLVLADAEDLENK